MQRAAIVIALTATMAPAALGSTLITRIQDSHGTGSNTLAYTSIRAVSYELGYTAELNGDACTSIRIGCTPIPLTALLPGATFDFVPGSPNFVPVATSLANGVNEQIWSIARMFGSSNAFLGAAAGSGNMESTWLDGSPDLFGWTIDRIRLSIVTVSLGPFCCANGGGFQFDSTDVWEVYGTPVATPTRSDTWGRVKIRYR